MAIDPKLIDEDIPREAAIFNQVTSNQAIRAVIAVVLTLVLAYQVVSGAPVSDTLLVITSAMIGYYFGVDVPVKKIPDK